MNVEIKFTIVLLYVPDLCNRYLVSSVFHCEMMSLCCALQDRRTLKCMLTKKGDVAIGFFPCSAILARMVL